MNKYEISMKFHQYRLRCPPPRHHGKALSCCQANNYTHSHTVHDYSYSYLNKSRLRHISTLTTMQKSTTSTRSPRNEQTKKEKKKKWSQKWFACVCWRRVPSEWFGMRFVSHRKWELSIWKNESVCALFGLRSLLLLPNYKWSLSHIAIDKRTTI